MSIVIRKSVSGVSGVYFSVGGEVPMSYHDTIASAMENGIEAAKRLHPEAPRRAIELAGFPDYFSGGRKFARDGYERAIQSAFRKAGL